MGMHQLPAELEQAHLPASGRMFNVPTGYLFGWGTTVGNGIEGWSPGALFIDVDGAADAQVHVNEGSKASATWTEVGTVGA